MQKLAVRLLTLFLFVAGVALWAAEVWIAKPYTEWTDKDLAKIMTDSPWAKKVSVTMDAGFGGGAGGAGGGGGRGKGGGGGGGGFSGGGDATDPGVAGGGGGGIAETGGGGGGGRGGRGGGGGGGGGAAAPGGGVPEVDLTVRWQTAPTVQQALVKAQYGDAAGTSPEAQEKLKPQDMFYVIWVAGLPGSVRPRDEEAKKMLLALTTLTVKGKDPIVAADVVFPTPPAGRAGRAATDAHFLFPRTIALSPDDKEVEFATKFGKTKVQTKFNLKSMVINGKLGL